MPRPELWMSVFAGLSGGLVGVLWSGLVTVPWLSRARGATDPVLRSEQGGRIFAGAVLHAVGGAALGGLFWLGWGLIALVNIPWYLAGVTFGLLTWLGLAIPLLGTLALRLRGRSQVTQALAVEWLATCLAIGLFCSLAWHRYT
jgi:hypothetical protein